MTAEQLSINGLENGVKQQFQRMFNAQEIITDADCKDSKQIAEAINAGFDQALIKL